MIALCWSRHVHARTPQLCAVVGREGRSVVTACRGRWEAHPLDLIAWDAPADKRLCCGGCVRELALTFLASVPDPGTSILAVPGLECEPDPSDDDTADKRVVDVGLEETVLAELRDAVPEEQEETADALCGESILDPTWDGEPLRLARERARRQ